jgi:hypothetical protein
MRPYGSDRFGEVPSYGRLGVAGQLGDLTLPWQPYRSDRFGGLARKISSPLGLLRFWG